jgi:putative ABC transport system permease protein
MSGGLGMIVRRSLRQHMLSTVVTVVSVALGVGLVMSVFSLSTQSRKAFAGGPAGFDAVLGARGSQLQLVMNTVFHLETSPGNIPWAMYDEVARNPAVEVAIPYAVGDNYRGFRIVGTTPEIFTRFEYQAGQKLTPRKGGRVFDPELREAVVGSTVAIQTGLRVGSQFNPVHGFGSKGKEHDTDYTVVGILESTNSPSDRVIWIPIDGIFRMEDHVLLGAGTRYVPKPGVEIPVEHKEVSAVMLKLNDDAAGFMLQSAVNRQGKVATLAWPIDQVIADLFNKLGWVTEVLRLVAYLVMVVAAGSILASIYNTMNERRREFAILRALGARRSTVFSVIVLESATIALLGSLAGLGVYLAILGGAGAIVREQTGVVLELFQFHPVLVLAPVGMTLLGALAGLLPAFKAYSTDVARNLLPTS